MTRRDLKRFRLPRRLRAARPFPLASFTKAENGAVTIFAIVAFAMLLVMIGLIVDVSRVMSVHTQASSYADRVALAAAAQLDGRNNALTRARDAARNSIDPGFRFSLSGDRTVGIRQLTFMSTLAPDPQNPFTRSPIPQPEPPETGPGDVVTARWRPGSGFDLSGGFSMARANRETRYVLVDTTRETERFLFFPLLAALVPDLDQSATVTPQAVAGFERRVCNSAPLMMCNLNEAQGVGASFTPTRGQMIRARMQGGGNSWSPGNFGLLDVPGPTGSNGNGAANLRRYVGSADPGTFCQGGSVSVRPGQATGPIQLGFNTRFDMYNGAASSLRTEQDFAPARNVLKGLREGNNSCPTNQQSDDTTPLPRDNCFMPSGTWPNGIPSGAGSGCTRYQGTPRAGNGSWNRDRYWQTNHQGDERPPGYSSMTRYQVYRYEIEHNPPGLVQTPDEDGAPGCSNRTSSADPLRDRRVIQIAIVNCLEHQSRLNGSGQDVPVEAYAEVFMTEPVGNTQWWNASNQDMFVEMIGLVRPDLPGNQLYEYPVLAR